MEKEIEQLKNEIEREEEQYKIGCEYPTETPQFYSALERQRIRINDLKNKLIKLEEKQLLK